MGSATRIFGGGDHKMGVVTDTEERFAELERDLLRVGPSAELERRWSGRSSKRQMVCHSLARRLTTSTWAQGTRGTA
jgi:hypothetical protein